MQFDWEDEYFEIASYDNSYFKYNDSIVDLKQMLLRIESLVQTIKNDQANFDSFRLLGQYGEDLIGATDVDKKSQALSDKALIKLENVKQRIESRIVERETEIQNEIARLQSDTGLTYTAEAKVECSLCGQSFDEDNLDGKKRHLDKHDATIQTASKNKDTRNVEWVPEGTYKPLYENLSDEDVKDILEEIRAGGIKFKELSPDVQEELIQYSDDHKLYMGGKIDPSIFDDESYSTEGGYGSGKNRHGFGHSKWMRGAELNEDIIDAENMHRNQFLPMQVEETKNPFLEEYTKLADEYYYWNRQESEKHKDNPNYRKERDERRRLRKNIADLEKRLTDMGVEIPDEDEDV